MVWCVVSLVCSIAGRVASYFDEPVGQVKIQTTPENPEVENIIQNANESFSMKHKDTKL